MGSAEVERKKECYSLGKVKRAETEREVCQNQEDVRIQRAETEILRLQGFHEQDFQFGKYP